MPGHCEQQNCHFAFSYNVYIWYSNRIPFRFFFEWVTGSESSNGDSVPELGVFVRKKRVKKIVQVEEEEHEAESDDKKVWIYLVSI